MRIVRIYQAGSYNIGDEIQLSIEAGLHVGVVLRMQAGQSIVLFCGDGYDYTATINKVQRKVVTVRINERHFVANESNYAIHLAQAVSRGERMDFVVQKAVELGVASLTPIITQYSAAKFNREQKLAHWQRIIIAACEQSGRAIVPILYPVVNFDTHIHTLCTKTTVMLEPTAKVGYCVGNTSSITLLIGAEGGFSPEELRMADDYGIAQMKLGPRILRTETAAIAAISVLQSLQGDLNL